MQTVSSLKEMQVLAERIRAQGKTIALVPTMGFLHPGHLSLMHEGRRRGDVTLQEIERSRTRQGQMYSSLLQRLRCIHQTIKRM
jgi:pantoate--beta-alanine ligase